MPNYTPSRHDLSGKRFGRWTALRAVPGKAKWTVGWECKCDCGTIGVVPASRLRCGRSKSCGCYRKEFSKKKWTTHGMFGTLTYRTWAGMITRCTNANEKCYPSYGGRGITVCERWRSFENFYADMGEKPRGMTLDRIDVDGNYEPSNCRWASIQTQSNNKRTNRTLTFNGKTKTAAEWARSTGIGHGTILLRIKRGWPTRRILTEPPRIGKNQFG